MALLTADRGRPYTPAFMTIRTATINCAINTGIRNCRIPCPGGV